MAGKEVTDGMLIDQVGWGGAALLEDGNTCSEIHVLHGSRPRALAWAARVVVVPLLIQVAIISGSTI
jgi:hypothetical protein